MGNSLTINLPKINFIKTIKAKRPKVFEIATNYESFQKILPQYFSLIQIKSRRNNATVVEEHLKIVGKELAMMTKHVTKYPDIHEVFVIGGDAKGSHIIEKYESIDRGTRLIFEADLKLNGKLGIIDYFKKNKIETGFSKIMDDLAKIAEG